MLERWTEDWRQLGRRAQFALMILSVLIVVLSLWGAVDNLLDRDYEEAAAFPLAIVVLGSRFVLWPFWLASAVRRRGGRFQMWLAVTLLLGFVIPGIAYFAWRSDHPILADSE